MDNLELINNIYNVNDQDTSGRIMKYQRNMVFNRNNEISIKYVFVLEDVYIPGADDFGNLYMLKFSKNKCYQLVNGMGFSYVNVFHKKIYLKELRFFGDHSFVTSGDVVSLFKWEIDPNHEKISIPEYFNIEMKPTKDIPTNIENLNINNDIRYLYDINGNLSTMINPIYDSFISKDFYMYCMDIVNDEDKYRTFINTLEFGIVYIKFTVDYIYNSIYGSIIFEKDKIYEFQYSGRTVLSPTSCQYINMISDVVTIMYDFAPAPDNEIDNADITTFNYIPYKNNIELIKSSSIQNVINTL